MPRTNRSGLTPAIIEELRRQGLNQSQIAELYGVTRQHVSWVRHNYDGVIPTTRELLKQHFPFRAGSRFHASTYERLLRNHMEYMVTGGKGMSEDKLRRLQSFYNKLRDGDLVVEFDPDNPPSPGNKPGGYELRKREDSDGDLIIRVNDHANLTDEGKMLWRWPPRFPEIVQ